MRKLVNIYHHIQSLFFSLVYRFPIKRLKVIFVTGTDGKTTTASLIYQILNNLGYKVGLLSTVEARIKNLTIDTGLHTTTPSNSILQKVLKQMVSMECEYAVIEITSHAIDQHRIIGTKAICSVITNITREHLDYFKTYEELVNTKAKLVKVSNITFLNKNDPALSFLVEYAKRFKCNFQIYDRSEAVINLSDEWKAKFPGDYNLENAQAAISVCRYLGISNEKIFVGLGTANPPKGRLEKIQNDLGLNLYVDFAHTPNSLNLVLQALKKKHASGNLIVVFGSAGLRDKYKRPLMGEFAKKNADFVVVTAEDPRTENVSDISKEIEKGIIKSGGILNEDYFFEFDRQKAIDFAVNKLAKKGDTIVITGKGHEMSMCFGTTEYPWSDFEAVKKVLGITNK